INLLRKLNLDHCSAALFARATISFTSLAEVIGNTPTTSPVAGLRDSKVFIVND
ncbi:MAG: hypothetical protein RLZZ159_415, partial [Actinomycetota bacterium]